MLDHLRNQIVQRLEALLQEVQEPKLREVMMYSALGGGKRIRPLLMLASTEAVYGSYYNAALDFACAIEMIHAYSLAHDDLPAMDNDDFRWGRPTCHKAFTEGLAVLAGDGLLSFAVEVMARRINNSSLDSLLAARALNCIIKAAGANGMVAGQMSDLINEGQPIDAETLTAIHRRKTGCLITACFEAGAILGGANDTLIQDMVKLGQVVGLAFQIKDDILDVTSTAETLGKPIGSDEANQKATYVSVHGLAAAEAEYERLSREAMSMLDAIPCKTDTLRSIISQTIARTK